MKKTKIPSTTTEDGGSFYFKQDCNRKYNFKQLNYNVLTQHISGDNIQIKEI